MEDCVREERRLRLILEDFAAANPKAWSVGIAGRSVVKPDQETPDRFVLETVKNEGDRNEES